MHECSRTDPAPVREVVGLALLVALAALLRAVIAAELPLADDEAYYWTWSLGAALSYLDHPPMVAWLIAAGCRLAGDTELGVRLGAVLASLVLPVAAWRTADLLFGHRAAAWTVLFMLAMPLLAVGGVIMTPDVPSVLFWTLATWALAELHRSQNAQWWLAVGLFAGLGLLGKLTNLFLGASILLWLLAMPANRRWLAYWQAWAGGALALVLFLPVIVWNAGHGWASFGKQLGRVAHHKALGLQGLGELAGGMVLLASPAVFALAVAGLVALVRRSIGERHAQGALVVALIVPLLGYFIVHATHDRVQANWPAPIYPALAMCAAVAVCRIRPARTGTRLATAATALGLACVAGLYMHAFAPLYVRDNLKDPILQLHGWRQTVQEIESLRQQSGAEWIATTNYTTTARLAFELGGRVPVEQLTERIRYEHLAPTPADTLRAPALYVEIKRRVVASYVVYRLAGPRGDVLHCFDRRRAPKDCAAPGTGAPRGGPALIGSKGLSVAASTRNHKWLVRLIAEAGMHGRRRREGDAVASSSDGNEPGARDLRPFGRPPMIAGDVATACRWWTSPAPPLLAGDHWWPSAVPAICDSGY